MKIRKNPETPGEVQVRAGTQGVSIGVDQLLATIASVLAEPEGSEQWFAFGKKHEPPARPSVVPDEEPTVFTTPGIETPAARGPNDEAEGPAVEVDPYPDPEAHLPINQRTFKVWKVYGTTHDGRIGNWPIRAYSNEEFEYRLKKLEEGGFVTDRILPPPRN